MFIIIIINKIKLLLQFTTKVRRSIKKMCEKGRVIKRHREMMVIYLNLTHDQCQK